MEPIDGSGEAGRVAEERVIDAQDRGVPELVGYGVIGDDEASTEAGRSGKRHRV
jgi:hypothetical protein